jgi:ferric-dicitrate binding protein FerR (iron transport regulator)
MRTRALATSVVMFCSIAAVDVALAQDAKMGCSLEQPSNATQVLRCRGAVTIVAEDGAKFTLHDRDNDGEADSVNLKSKAVLIDVGKQRDKGSFEVTTPQAIAAVRGTKWAVDIQQTRTSVLVLRGQVAVRRPVGAGEVVLGPGQGVDVDAGTTDPLVVKNWPQARVVALLARLGQ